MRFMGSFSMTAKIAFMNAVILSLMAVSLIYISAKTTGVTAVIDRHMGTLEGQKIANAVVYNFSELRFWLADLAISGAFDSEKKANEARKRLDELFDKLKSDNPKLIENIQPKIGEYFDLMMAASDDFLADNAGEGNAKVSEARTLANKVNEELGQMLNIASGKSRSDGELVITTNKNMRNASIYILAVASIIGIALSWLLSRSIICPLLALVNGVTQIRESGDLSIRVPVTGKDEITTLSKSINGMLEKLLEARNALELRNKEVRDILDNVGQGILTFSKDLVVNNERSAFADKIFEKSPGGLPITELLFDDPAKKEGFAMWGGMVFGESLFMGIDSIIDLAEKEVSIRANDTSKILSMEYRPIYESAESSSIKKVMAVITDITAQKKQEAMAEKEREEHEQIVKILRNQESFVSFNRNAREIIKHSLATIGELVKGANPALVNELFRGMHTIKGTAAVFAIKDVSGQAHEIENTLNEVRNGGMTATDELVRDVIGKLQSLDEGLSTAVKKISDILGESAGGGAVIKVKEEKLAKHKRLLESLRLDEENRKAILGSVMDMMRIPAGQAFRMFKDLAIATAEKTGKRIEGLNIVNPDFEIDINLVKSLDAPMTHIIRNAVDHGVEEPEDRVMLGKSEEGHINMELSRIDDKITIRLSDDGKGIEADAIRRAAVRKNLMSADEASHLSDNEAIALIFAPGFSSKEETTDVSGRGVGMDVVKTEIEKLGGAVFIETVVGEGSTFSICIAEDAAAHALHD